MKQKFNRDQILGDLREHVCEIFVQDNTGKQVALRCSLKPELLPNTYLVTEEAKERQFHAEHPEFLSAWDIMNGGWKQFHIDAINYIQIVDTY